MRYILSIFILVCQLSIAQTKFNEVDVAMGSIHKIPLTSQITSIVGHDSTGFYALRNEPRGLAYLKTDYIIEHYNNDLNKINQAELKLHKNGRKFTFEHFIHLNNQLYLFSSVKDQQLKKNILFVQTLNKETFSPNEDLVKVAEIRYDHASKYNSGEYKFELSRDSSKVLVYYNLPYKPESSEKLGFHVLDSDMNQLWERNVELPYKNKLFELEDFIVDNAGNVHLLGLVYKHTKRKKKNSNPYYSYKVLSYYTGSSEEMEYSIDLEGKFINDLEIAVNDRQNVICGGFYSSEGTRSIEGSCFFSIDVKSKEIVNSNFYKFKVNFIAQGMSNRKKNKAERKAQKGKEVELYNYEMEDLLIREDGNVVLIAEHSYIDVSMRQSGTTTTTSYIYHCNDIIIVNITPDGEVDWVEKIVKRQKSANDNGRYLSFTSFARGNNLHFIYSDHLENLNFKGEGKPKVFSGSKKSSVVLITIDDEGNKSKEILCHTKDAGVMLLPNVYDKLTEDELIIFGVRKKKGRALKLSF